MLSAWIVKNEEYYSVPSLVVTDNLSERKNVNKCLKSLKILKNVWNMSENQ